MFHSLFKLKQSLYYYNFNFILSNFDIYNKKIKEDKMTESKEEYENQSFDTPE